MKARLVGQAFIDMSGNRAQLEMFLKITKKMRPIGHAFFDMLAKARPAKHAFLPTAQKACPARHVFHTLFPKSTYFPKS